MYLVLIDGVSFECVILSEPRFMGLKDSYDLKKSWKLNLLNPD
jgi:hypothetical protein